MKFTRNKKHSSRLNTFYCFSNWRRPNWLQKVSFLYPQIKPEHHLDSRLRLLPLVGWIRFYEAWFCVIIIGLLGEVMTWFNSLTTIAKSKMEMKHFFKRVYSQIPKNNHNHQHRRLIVNACMHGCNRWESIWKTPRYAQTFIEMQLNYRTSFEEYYFYVNFNLLWACIVKLFNWMKNWRIKRGNKNR